MTTIKTAWKLNLEDVREQMERNGGVAKKLSSVTSTVKSICTVVGVVQERMWKLTPWSRPPMDAIKIYERNSFSYSMFHK